MMPTIAPGGTLKLRSSISRRSPNFFDTFLNSITFVAEAFARRDEDLVRLVALLVVDRLQAPRCAPGALPFCGRPWRSAAPTRVPSGSPSAAPFRRLFLLQAFVLLHQPFGVVALPRDTAAAVEFEDPLRRVVEEVAVVGDRDHGAGVAGQELLQPFHRLGVEVVGRFVQQQHVRLLQQQAAQRDAALLAARQLADHRVPRRQAQRVGGDFQLVLRVCASPAARMASSRSCSLASARRSPRLPRRRRRTPASSAACALSTSPTPSSTAWRTVFPGRSAVPAAGSRP